jgi:hypothetical protein
VTGLTREKGKLVLSFSPESAAFMGEAVQKRLDKLADLLRLKSDVRL